MEELFLSFEMLFLRSSFVLKHILLCFRVPQTKMSCKNTVKSVNLRGKGCRNDAE